MIYPQYSKYKHSLFYPTLIILCAFIIFSKTSLGMATSLPSPQRGLPSSSVGHLPEIVSDEDQGKYRVMTEFEVPPLLTDAQLAEQIGSDRVDFDPLWFLYDPRPLPCFKRAATLGTGVGSLIGASIYWRTRRFAPTSLGIAASWFSTFALSWGQCRSAYKALKMHDPASAMSMVQQDVVEDEDK